MPLYNKRETVVEAIESMLAQTRVPDEIVIVDDGSTDGSADLVEARYGNNSLIRLIRQENRGVSAARNRAISSTKAPLLAFLDGDDRWLPQRIEKQAAIMESRQNCMIVIPAAMICDERNGTTWIEGDRINRDTYLSEYFREEQLPVCSGIMVHRTALDQLGLFDESLRMGEDHDLWLRVMMRYGFEHLAEPLVWYRACRSESLPSVERDFAGNDKYFAKHRYTFGRGLIGQSTWRAAYAAVLRKHAIWYLRHNEGFRALRRLAKAIWMWPFFNPKELTKAGLEYLLGPRAYASTVSRFRRLSGRRRAMSHD